MQNKCNLVELFSGIGSQAKALKNLDLQVNTLGTSEWDVHAIAAYDVIHNSPDIPEDILQMDKPQLLDILQNYTFSNSGKTPLKFSSFSSYSVEVLQRILTSIRRNKNFVDVSHLDGTQLSENIDILTYSFPCQDLSNVGAFHGYKKGIDKGSGSRSSLLWQVGRILTEMKNAGKKLPRYLLMENVPTLLSKRHLGNFSTWISDLEKLGYISQHYQLNASSFGLPQNRPRLLMISVHVGDNYADWELVSNYFEQKRSPDDVVNDYRSSKYYRPVTVQELLRTNYNNRKIRAEAIECTPNDTVSRRKIWDENPKIILEDGSFNQAITTVRTITTKQDRNPNSGNLYFDSEIEGRSKFRYLTPRECLLFMGFTDEDYRSLKYNNLEFHKGDAIFARDKIIRMAGNSIPVKLLEGIFYQIIQIDVLLDNLHKQSCPFDASALDEYYSSMIRSFAFKKGIRSRIGTENYPKNATVVYPKHKTAIYVCCDEAFEGMHSLPNITYWENHIQSHVASAKAKCKNALDMGWNVLLILQRELKGESREATLSWITDCIKNSNDEGNGVLISRDRLFQD